MTYKLNWTTHKEIQKLAPHVNWHFPSNIGIPGELPEGWREITELEVAKSKLRSYGPDVMDYRYIPTPDEKFKTCSVWMFHWNDGTGIGMRLAVSPDEPAIRWYAFGCAHDYRELSMQAARDRGIEHWGIFCHVYVCSKCEHTKVEDSSG